MSVTLEGFPEVKRQYDGIQKKMETLPDDFKQEGSSILLSDVHQTFATEGGGTWAPRDPDSKGSHPLLQKTGAGLRSIKVRFGRNFIERYTSKYYMRFHEFGTKREPKREFMKAFSETAMELLKAAYERTVLK